MQNASDLINNLTVSTKEILNFTKNRLENCDVAILSKPSNSGGWSILQCLDHLNSYGCYYLPAIEKSLLNGEKYSKNDQFESSWLGNYFTKMMLPNSPKKYKAVKKHLPNTDLNAKGVISEFLNQQKLLMNYLESSNNTDLNKIKIPISITKFIRLKLGDVFQFIVAHNQRHIEQAMRNL